MAQFKRRSHRKNAYKTTFSLQTHDTVIGFCCGIATQNSNRTGVKSFEIAKNTTQKLKLTDIAPILIISYCIINIALLLTDFKAGSVYKGNKFSLSQWRWKCELFRLFPAYRLLFHW